MSKIITITLNTAIDNIVEIDRFEIGLVTKAKSYFVPSGKGINVCRTIAGLKESAISLGFVGEKEITFFKELNSEHIGIELDVIDAKTRVNVTILDSKHNLVIHTRATGYSLNGAHIKSLLTKLRTTLKKNDIVVISGSVPNHQVNNAYARIIKLCKAQKIKVILDANGPAFENGVKSKPYVIKPNVEELEMLTSRLLKNDEEIVSAAKSLNMLGIEFVFVSNGEKGVILTRKDTSGYWKGFIDHHFSEFSGMEIGCGDAMVGGISVGLLRNDDTEHLLRLSIGCATANLFTKIPGKIDEKLVKKFAKETIVRSFNH